MVVAHDRRHGSRAKTALSVGIRRVWLLRLCHGLELLTILLVLARFPPEHPNQKSQHQNTNYGRSDSDTRNGTCA